MQRRKPHYFPLSLSQSTGEATNQQLFESDSTLTWQSYGKSINQLDIEVSSGKVPQPNSLATARN